jgi:hypothetical protein
MCFFEGNGNGNFNCFHALRVRYAEGVFPAVSAAAAGAPVEPRATAKSRATATANDKITNKGNNMALNWPLSGCGSGRVPQLLHVRDPVRPDLRSATESNG